VRSRLLGAPRTACRIPSSGRVNLCRPLHLHFHQPIPPHSQGLTRQPSSHRSTRSLNRRLERLALYPGLTHTASVAPPNSHCLIHTVSIHPVLFTQTKKQALTLAHAQTILYLKVGPPHHLIHTAPRSARPPTRAWEVARTVVAPPSSVVKCLWEVFVWGFGVLFLSCVCVGVGGVVLCRCVCVTC